MQTSTYYQDGKLTLDGMRQTIKNGGSVLHNGKLLTRYEDLPSEADLAQGNPAREQAAREALQRQVDDALHQLAMLSRPSAEMAEPLTPGQAGHGQPGTAPVSPDLTGSVPPASGPAAGKK